MEGYREAPEPIQDLQTNAQGQPEAAAFQTTGVEETSLVPVESGSALSAQPDRWAVPQDQAEDLYAETDNAQARQAFVAGIEEAMGEGNGYPPEVFEQVPTYAQIEGDLAQEFQKGNGIPTSVVERARSMGVMRVAGLRMGIALPPADAPDTDYNRALRIAHGLPVQPRPEEPATDTAQPQ